MVEKELEKLHRDIEFSLGQFTLMLAKRKYSPSALRICAQELQGHAYKIIEFVERNAK